MYSSHYKANLRDLIAVTSPLLLLKLDSNHWFCCLCNLEIKRMTSKNKKGTSCMLRQALYIIAKQSLNWNRSYTPETPILVKIFNFLSRVTLKFDGWPWLHHSVQTGVTVHRLSIPEKISDFLFSVTLKSGGWLWKTIGHLSFATSSFVHHFVVISPSQNNAKIRKINRLWSRTNQF